jgi:integrase
MLTDKELKGLKPTDKDQFILAGKKLYLRVHTSGRKEFLYRHKSKWIKLGDYPNLGLADARKLATNFVHTPEGIAEDIPTVDKVFTAFYKHVKRRYVNPEQFMYKYEKEIKPVLGSRDIRTVKRAEVAKLLEKIVERGSPIMANRVLTDIKLIFGFAVERGDIENNVLLPLTKKAVGGKEKPRTKVLSVEEIKNLLIELRTPRMDYRTRAALALALLTGQRASEVLGICKAQINGCWWHIPTDQKGNKNKKLHKVYLSPQARMVLKIVPPPYVGDHRVMARAIKRRGVSYTPHDFRRTITTHLNDKGVMPHVTEKMLNHTMEGVMAVYNHAEYLPERKAAWRLWGAYLAGLRREVRHQTQEPSA